MSDNLSKKEINNKKNIHSKHLATSLTAVLLVIVLLFTFSWIIYKKIKGKILPKVTVAGLNVGNKTPDEAKKIVLNYIASINTQGPEILYNDQLIKPKLTDLGVSFDTDQLIDTAFNFGRKGTFKDKVFQNAKLITGKNDIALNPQIDEKQLDTYLSTVTQTVQKTAQDASIAIDNGNLVVSDSQDGIGLDQIELKKQLVSSIQKNQLNNKITLVTSEIKPKILKTGTIQAQEKAQKYLDSSPINFFYEDKTFTASRTIVGSWIEFSSNEDQVVANLSDSKIKTYSSSIAKKVAVSEVDEQIMDGTGEIVTQGQDGLGVDTSKLVNDIKTQILNNATQSQINIVTYAIPKKTVTYYPDAMPGRFEGRYIDVNLTKQTLYAFEGTNLVNQFLISSGIYSHPTPTGTFSVYGQTRAQTMDGPGYSLPNVEWISWWSGDYSIHGTYWHHNFGHPMSHGCINASNGDAEWVYNWVDIGTPVYVHW